jgi:3-oxoacyl-[acyl-carrier-protein] synthase II
MKKRVVFTGIGILACNAQGREAFWDSLYYGVSGEKKISLFDADPFNVAMAGEVSDFDPKAYMGRKGLRSLDRSTKMLVSASKMALADSRLEITDANTDATGVCVGTTLGSLKSIHDFDETTLKEGPRYTNPALFPNTVINSPASQVSIWNHIQGFNTTISTGFTASIDAMHYAYDFIRSGRAQCVLTGGVEELCWQTFYGFHALRFLSGAREGQRFINCPFDKRRNGIMLSEGAALLSMEEYGQARKRKAPVLGEVLGFGYSFDPYRINKYNPRGTGLKTAIRKALKDARVTAQDIDCICANANSTPQADKIETEAIKDIFGKQAYQIPVTAVKSMIGESFSASGALAAAAALGIINKHFIPPTVNYHEKDPACDLDYVPNKVRAASVNKILIITFGPNGSSSCMVVGKIR